MDETQIFFNMGNHKTLGRKGTTKVNYAGVVAGGDGLTMVLRIFGGANASIHQSFLIFKNKQRNYSMKNLPDNVEGVSYCTRPNGWMDQIVFNEWLNESRTIEKDVEGRRRILFVDNCSGHKITTVVENSLEENNTSVEFIPQNSTILCPPLDSFIIKEIKSAWRRLWDAEKTRIVMTNNWMTGPNSPGKLWNPGKLFYMNLAAQRVNEVNSRCDSDGNSLVRKAMIRCGMSLDYNGTWNVSQLFQHLQQIVNRYPMNLTVRFPNMSKI